MPQPMQQLLFTFGLQQAGLKWGNEVGSHWHFQQWTQYEFIESTLCPEHQGPILCHIKSILAKYWKEIFSSFFGLSRNPLLLVTIVPDVGFQSTKEQINLFPVIHLWKIAIARSRWIHWFKWNVFKNLNVIIVFSPFLLAQRLWSFLVL